MNSKPKTGHENFKAMQIMYHTEETIDRSILDFTEQPLFQGLVLELTLFRICLGFEIVTFTGNWA